MKKYSWMSSAAVVIGALRVKKQVLVKMIWCTFKESNSAIIFSFPSQWGQLLKEKNCFLRKQVFSFKSRPY